MWIKSHLELDFLPVLFNNVVLRVPGELDLCKKSNSIAKFGYISYPLLADKTESFDLTGATVPLLDVLWGRFGDEPEIVLLWRCGDLPRYKGKNQWTKFIVNNNFHKKGIKGLWSEVHSAH